ncbi:hypothetical protein [Sinimarinibacterium sp. NLF-5-8]|uniref:hypothetical protein n=1 Tax=Sinimarinibacterium sp. NLF-5-8 TaxID=2698684 RepID=UPI00137C307C|nr:hypothetical protein [Sinimarinibacterium sp. NLF-5-8]QHS10007.1 hypothetical protein GT972_07535 [Sinimarinibacterium sp. NLF-5-8]
MQIEEYERQRLLLLDRLLQAQDYLSAEQLITAQAPLGILGDAAFGAARALRLTAAVVYLATLGAANLAQPNDRKFWLSVYQSLTQGRLTAEFLQIAARLPVSWVLREALKAPGSRFDVSVLKRCRGTQQNWIDAVELSIDLHQLKLCEQLVRHRLAGKAPMAEILALAQAIVGRQGLVKRLHDLEPLARSLAMIRQHLPNTQQFEDIRNLLASPISACFLKSGCYEQAEQFAHQISGEAHQFVRTRALAKIACHAGDTPRSIALLDQLLESLLTVDGRHWLQAQQQLRAEEHAKLGGQPFAPDAAAQALRDLQSVLSAAGQAIFLVSGTLLGYMRERDFLAHDKDIDVGVFAGENPQRIVDALLGSDLFWAEVRTTGERPYHIPVQHLFTGISIDVFIYHAQADRWVTGVQSDFGFVQTFAFTPFELRKIQFLDIDFYIPDPPEYNLFENYGAWQVPDPEYISHLESPSTLAVGGLVYQLVGRRVVLHALEDGHFIKAARALDLLEQHHRRPGGMSLALIEALRAGF